MQKTPYIAGAPEETDGRLSKFPDWREGIAILMERAWMGAMVAILITTFSPAEAAVPNDSRIAMKTTHAHRDIFIPVEPPLCSPFAG